MRVGDRLLFGASAATIAAATVLVALAPIPWPSLAAGVALVATADRLRVRLTGERPSSLAVAPGLGLALLTGDPAFVIVAFAAGTGLAGLLRRRNGSNPAVGAHLLAVSAAAVVYAIGAPLDPTQLGSSAGAAAHLAPIATALAIATLAAVDIGIRSQREDQRVRTVARALLPFHLAAASAAGLFALAEPVLGAPAYALFLAPLMATHHAFEQLSSVRRTFQQMIGALSSVPEVAGYSHPGHAARTADLARRTGRELRMSDRELDELEIAARLHDLGRLRAGTPDDVASLPVGELAASGAHVVRTTGALPRVAAILERAHEPFANDAAIPLGARVVRAASVFDDLTGTGSGSLSADDAMRSMWQGTGRFDPAVLDALARVTLA